jgi:hypothetical protein
MAWLQQQLVQHQQTAAVQAAVLILPLLQQHKARPAAALVQVPQVSSRSPPGVMLHSRMLHLQQQLRLQQQQHGLLCAACMS